MCTCSNGQWHQSIYGKGMELCQRKLVWLLLDTIRDWHRSWGEAPSIKQSVPYTTQEEVACQLYKMKKLDVVQPLKSPRASPVMLANKERQMPTILYWLNSPIIFRYPKLMAKLDRGKFPDLADLASGLWQICVHIHCQEKAVFSTSFGFLFGWYFQSLYRGLRNA